jgi:hypothetical protein
MFMKKYRMNQIATGVKNAVYQDHPDVGVEQVDRRVLLEPDEPQEHRQQEHRAGHELRADDRRAERLLAAEPQPRQRVARAGGERRRQHRRRRADDQRVDEVLAEVHGLPHLLERRHRRVQQVVLAGRELAARLQAGDHQPCDRREHDRQHRVCQRVQRPVRKRAP